MKRFNLLNTIFGWVAFAIAAITYLLTIEPTASFWDCGEFISTAYKLDVGHPPGAPFFMLTGKFFSLFASDPTKVAMMINAMSAILSALTILFLFWTITHIARKIIIKNEQAYTTANTIMVLGAGLVGALAYTFSDTFWFSAVEGEVYAYSSFFTAVVFWLILKWENVADKEGSDRWLILIAYLMGLSIGVHLLNLLTIPAIVLVYYFKKYKPSAKGLILALLTSVAILAFVLYGLIPGFVEIASWFELLFVNKLGLPFNSGMYAYILLAIAALVWAIYETYSEKSYVRMAVSFILAVSIVGIPFIRTNILVGILIIIGMIVFFYLRKGKIPARWLNTAITMVTVMLIGYSSYTVIVIRSAANPPMDQNSPDNVFALKYYLNREQYGDNPLLYGPVYNAPVKYQPQGNYCVPVEKTGKPNYAPKPKESPDQKDEYIITGYKSSYVMDEKFNMLFPRMYYSPGNSDRHVELYKSWGGVKGKRVSYDACGRREVEMKPTFGENMRYFFRYQLGFMYWRYFMWNFSGRQNDIQGNGEIENGNWITGIKFIDNVLVGDQDSLPTDMKENKGRNRYYMLPLLLGIIGIIFLLNSGKEGKHSFWIVLLLFVLTGIAIVVYLNQPPMQPRERDYAYAGSFYAFSIFIGLGVLGIIRAIDKYVPRKVSSVVVSIICLGVPILMAAENWDDHDRSGRYLASDFGNNYLISCKPNAIIFSNGDNDTFPLWYNQEVEGNRTDVRVCNLSYLQTDWYIDQMRRGAYESAPLPISWEPKDYVTGNNEVLYMDNDKSKHISSVDVNTLYSIMLKHNASERGKKNPYMLRTQNLYIPVDADQVIKTGTLPEERRDEIVPQIDIKVNRRLTKSEMMVVEMLKENNWERPMYFAVTVGDEYYMGLKDHFELTGLAYNIVPVKSETGVNTDEMYDNMMNKFRYGNVSDPNIYIDEKSMSMCRTHRLMFLHLIEALMTEGDTERAKKALDYCDEVLPGTSVPYDYHSTLLANFYYQLNEPEKGDKMTEYVAQNCVEHLNWYFNLSPAQQKASSYSIGRKFLEFNNVISIFQDNNRTDLMDKYYPSYIKFHQKIGY
ncbi:DUF2723 domain-containing protein [Paludibacter sp. 221]|uniref:glycosyltransferase family 117 protein n=1 Tax=Paludibacter sp. 221 TaxID=2302939 RepID=UPI0013D5778D|nr:DUF2723 domain-containing protein [Paludibacter sp. 221]NDV46562.1 DUF2723 domain-containing protein [Paludibacter sp. 221]